MSIIIDSDSAEFIRLIDGLDKRLREIERSSSTPTFNLQRQHNPQGGETSTPLTSVVAVSNLAWQETVKDKDLNTPPGGESDGDRYLLVGGAAAGAWAGQDDSIAQINISVWGFTTPTEGMACYVDDENSVYVYTGAAWVELSTIIDHGSVLGLTDDDHPQYPLKTGWDLGIDESDVTIAMTDGSRTFTITPDSTLDYWIAGIKYTLSSPDTVVINDTEGIWFIYFVGSTLTASQTPWDQASASIAMISLVYWDAANNESVMIGWELHSWVMDGATREESHWTFGTRFRTGLAVSDNGDGTVDVTTGIVYDEDIKIEITDGVGGTLFEQDLSPAKLPILYRDGAGGDWRKVGAATTAPVTLTANVLQLNELNGTWALSGVTLNKYIAYWILATDDIAEPIISIPGQVEGTTANAVRDANPLSSMSFGSLPVNEYKVIARMIVKRIAGGIFYEITDIDDFRDVSTEPGTGTTITDHSSLTNVTTSQHHVLYTNAEAIAAVEGEATLALSGDVGIHTAPTRARFEVKDDGMGHDIVARFTADDGTPFVLILGNTTFSDDNYDGLGFWVDNAGKAFIQNNYDSPLDLILQRHGANLGIGMHTPPYKVSINAGASPYQLGFAYNSQTAVQWILGATSGGDFAMHEEGVGNQVIFKAGGNVDFPNGIDVLGGDLNLSDGHIVINDTGLGALLTLDADGSGTPANYILLRDLGGNTAFIGHGSAGSDILHFFNYTTANVEFGVGGSAKMRVGNTAITSLITHDFSAGIDVAGSIESSTFSSAINSQVEDPPNNSVAVGSPEVYRGETSNNWITGSSSEGSLDTAILDYPANANDSDLLVLNLSKIKVTVDNPTYTYTHASRTMTLQWFYSIDGGSSWVLGGSDTFTGVAGTIDFDALTVEIDGNTLTGDLKVQLKHTQVDGASEALNLANWTVSYSVALKTGS